MRISDWSSDVCSSDLADFPADCFFHQLAPAMFLQPIRLMGGAGLDGNLGLCGGLRKGRARERCGSGLRNANLGELVAAFFGNAFAQYLNQDIRPFGEFGRNGLKQCFLAAVEPDDAPAAGNDGVDEAARRDRASKRALAVALDISLQYLTLVDQGGAAFADAFLVEPLRQGDSLRREGASARRTKANRQRRYSCLTC